MCLRWDRQSPGQDEPTKPREAGLESPNLFPGPRHAVFTQPSVSGCSSTASPQPGHCPSSCRFFQVPNLNLRLWFPLPGPAVPSVGLGASSQPVFLQVLLPLPSFTPQQPHSPSSLPWNSRKSHFNLSGLTWQPPAPISSLGAGKASGEPPAALAQPLQPLPMARVPFLMSRSHIPTSGDGHSQGRS